MLRWSKLVINSNLLIALLFFYTLPLKSQNAPKEMVLVPRTKFHFIQVNRWREGLQLLPYKEGPIGDAYVDEYEIQIDSFYIDKYEVTNKEYKEFLDKSGYKPKWPWGDKWNPKKANVNSNGTKPVGSYPKGASPFGVLDMAGNVAEMTDSFQDDGWHWFSYIRGGSWFQSFGSLWYMENGVVTNRQRLKFWWLNPGFNRSSAIGFRCVKKMR